MCVFFCDSFSVFVLASSVCDVYCVFVYRVVWVVCFVFYVFFVLLAVAKAFRVCVLAWLCSYVVVVLVFTAKDEWWQLFWFGLWFFSFVCWVFGVFCLLGVVFVTLTTVLGCGGIIFCWVFGVVGLGFHVFGVPMLCFVVRVLVTFLACLLELF